MFINLISMNYLFLSIARFSVKSLASPLVILKISLDKGLCLLSYKCHTPTPTTCTFMPFVFYETLFFCERISLFIQ